ncbi:MAG: calcium-binding protein [Acidimicrobiia bacterium]|nr:calcium-binding protein [Acidimicrobiia bacterium]
MPATLVGTPGADTLMGTPNADIIVAREGNDTIMALGGDDIVCAGKGDDVVYGGGGFDILFGAQGNDNLYSSDGASPAERVDTRGARMFGGAGNDRIYGSNRWDRMQGGPGDDQLYGYKGRDWLRAGPGNDTVDGGAGIDDQHGGNGRDHIRLTNGDVVRGGAGLDLCTVEDGEPSMVRSCGLGARETRPLPVEVPEDDVVPPERGEVVRSEDDIELTEPDPELVEESITFEEVIAGLDIETPCDLYSTPQLRTQMTEWSESEGLTADLPDGLLPSDTEIAFEAQVQTSTECSWFSEPQLWMVQIAFEPVSGFTDELHDRAQPINEIGDRASIDNDTRGFVEVGDLFVSITNLVPGHTQTDNDRGVLLLLMSDVATKLS